MILNEFNCNEFLCIVCTEEACYNFICHIISGLYHQRKPFMPSTCSVSMNLRLKPLETQHMGTWNCFLAN